MTLVGLLHRQGILHGGREMAVHISVLTVKMLLLELNLSNAMPEECVRDGLLVCPVGTWADIHMLM